LKKIGAFLFFLILGAVLTEGFQCASPEMTTAKLAIRNKDYTKAESNLEVEISKNSKNSEAWVLLAQVKGELGKLAEEANILKQTEKTIEDKNGLNQIYGMERKLWIDSYQQSVDEYNKYLSSNNKKEIDSAFYLMNVSLLLRPELAELTRMKGVYYLTLKDTTNIIKYFNDYIKLISNEVALAKEKHLFLGMSRDEAINILGKPIESKGIRYSATVDSTIDDFFKIDGKEVILNSQEKSKGFFSIEGWRVNPPANWSESDKTDLNTIEISPLAELAQIYFLEKDYKASINNVLLLLVLDPSNVDANTFLINVYEAQGGTEEAIKQCTELVKSNPENKFYRLQYGQLLFRNQKYQDAIDQFEKAEKIDSKFAPALRNLAAAYKNKAVMMQREQQDMADKDPKYKKKPDVYIPLLEKSANYFQKCLNSKEYEKDYYVLSELANIYFVLEKKPETLKALEGLEKLEPEIPMDERYNYYLSLLKIYSDLKMTDKMNRVKEEVEKYTPTN
jgi:tetratricopeptide (TPR) repeat protein